MWKTLTLLGLLVVFPINKLDLKIKILNDVFEFESKSRRQYTKQGSAP